MATEQGALVERASFCRICVAQCGILVRVDESSDMVLSVRGDPAHPVSKGYTCSKGRALAAFHHDPRRLDEPRLRGEVRPWNDTLEDLAAIVQTVGGARVGAYLATGLAYDSRGFAAGDALLRRLGSKQRYTPVSIDNAPKVRAMELLTGSGDINPCWEAATGRLLVLLGTNPIVSHGYGTTLPDPVTKLREFRGRGGEVWTIDVRRSETSAHADRSLLIRPGTNHLLLGWLVREVLRDGANADEMRDHVSIDDATVLARALEGYTLDRVTKVTGAPAEDLVALRDAIVAANGQWAAMAGTGVTMGPDGLVAECLFWTLLAITGSLDRPGGMRFNHGVLYPMERRPWAENRAPIEGKNEPGPASRPDLVRWGNQFPCAAMADEILAGHLRVLIVAGGNPLTAFPNSAKVRRALQALDALVVIDVVDNELTEIASHVLPAAGQLERADLSSLESITFANGTQYTEACVPVGANRRTAADIFVALGRCLGYDMNVPALEQVASGSRVGLDAIITAGPHGTTQEGRFGWVHELVLPDGRWRIAPPVLLERLRTGFGLADPPPWVLAPRRVGRHMNSAAYPSANGEVLEVRVPPTALVGDGASVRVRSATGAIEGVARHDAGLAPGTVSVTHGWSALNSSALTHAEEGGLDPFTGMPFCAGVAVELEALPNADALSLP